MYSAYKLNKQGDNIQPWCTPYSFSYFEPVLFSYLENSEGDGNTRLPDLPLEKPVNMQVRKQQLELDT